MALLVGQDIGGGEMTIEVPQKKTGPDDWAADMKLSRSEKFLYGVIR